MHTCKRRSANYTRRSVPHSAQSTCDRSIYMQMQVTTATVTFGHLHTPIYSHRQHGDVTAMLCVQWTMKRHLGRTCHNCSAVKATTHGVMLLMVREGIVMHLDTKSAASERTTCVFVASASACTGQANCVDVPSMQSANDTTMHLHPIHATTGAA